MPRPIAILTGGTSSERPIALQSAAFIASELSPRYDVRTFVFPEELPQYLQKYRDYDVAVPVFHGVGGEDGTVQGMLETFGVPYIFSRVGAHALAIQKALTKDVMTSHGILTPVARVVSLVPDDMVAPVVIKSLTGGSSLGVWIAQTTDEARRVLTDLLAREPHALIETYVTGREFTMPVIDRGGVTEVLPVIEIRSKHAFFDYETKYDADLVEELCPAPIDDALRDQLQQLAVAAHTLIGARHLTRTDCIVDADGRAWFLEINTIPGFTKNSLVPKSLRAAGIAPGELLGEWVEDSIKSAQQLSL